jgi:hypothetical protein
MPAWLGGLTACGIATYVFYRWHRARHEEQWLWFGLHQIHHCPQRPEVSTSFYKHPGETLVYAMIGTNENPAVCNDRCSFGKAREQRLGDRLSCSDVHER